MNTYFTSDPHLGHKLVSGLRGFPNTDDWDAAFVENWHATVKPEDTVWVLGDVTCAKKDDIIYGALEIIDSLPGTKHLIAGNHDPVHPMHKGAWKYMKTYLKAFASVQAFAKLSVEGQMVLLSHFPYNYDHTEKARYTQWRLPDEGRMLLHGHTHEEQRVTSPRELHVGLDAWGLKPVSSSIVAKFVLGDREAVANA